MTSLGQLRKNFTFVLAGLGAVNLVLVVYLLWPGGAAAAKGQEELLQQKYRTMTHDVAPLRGVDNKLLRSREDIKRFYHDQLPSRYSQISEQIMKLARDNGVNYLALSYSEESTELPEIQRVGISTTITADYAKIPRFINALERDQHLFLIIDSAAVNGQQGGVVTMQLKFDAYLKSTP